MVSPPYDVLSANDRSRLANLSPFNVVHIDCPLEEDGPDRYIQAGATIRQWVDQGILVLDQMPTLTIYRMRFVDGQGRSRESVGVLGAMEVADEGSDSVLPHERTTPKAKSDRLDLTRATRTNLSPVWGLSPAKGLTDLLSELGTEIGRCIDDNGVVHIVEVIEDQSRIAEVEYLLATAPVVIADGHHRYAISRTFRDEERQGKKSPGAEYTLTYIAELIEEQLNVAAIHRLYCGITAANLQTTLAQYFDVSDAGEVTGATLVEMELQGALCLVRPDGTGAYLSPKTDKFDGIRDLDGARLEHALAATTHEVGYQHGVDEVLGELRSARASAAVLIRPVTVKEIQRTADEHLLMPPKSTFFTPKLLTGLVFRPID